MKRNILIRMMCLLLCFCMITPITAGAFSPIYEYETIEGKLKYGHTTNEMAYVDQFFNGHGGYSDLGDELIEWLEMGSFENKDDSERVNSGYLMLEQEIDHQVEDASYYVTDIITRTARKSLDTVTSVGLNLAAEALSDAALHAKFKGAGASAQIYYQQLYHIYTEYQDQVMAEMMEADAAMEIAEGMIDTVTEYGVYQKNKAYAAFTKFSDEYNEAVNAYNKINDSTPEYKTEVYALTRGGAGGTHRKTQVYTFEDIAIYPANNVVITYELNGQQMVGSMSQLIEDAKNLNTDAVFVVPTALNKKLESNTVGVILQDGFSEVFQDAGTKVKLADMKLKHLEGILDAMSPDELNLDAVAGDKEAYQAVMRGKQKILKRVDADYEKVADQYYADLDAAQKKMDTAQNDMDDAYTDLQKAERFSDWMDNMDLIGTGVSAIVDTYNMKAQQAMYTTIAAGVKNDYVQMLKNWVTMLENGNGPNNSDSSRDEFVRADIIAAVNALLNDIESRNLEFQEQAKKLGIDTLVMSSRSLADIAVTVFEGTSTYKKYEAAIKATKEAAAYKAGTEAAQKAGKFTKIKELVTANPLLAVSLATNLVSQEFVNFGDDTSAIYYLKWSLADSLMSRGGLLDQYNENRTHQTACAIIEALNTMKTAKYVGENYVNDYYLSDFYDDLDIEPSGGMHAIFANELMMSNGKMEMKVDPYITSAYIVYEKGVKVQVGNDTKKMTVIQGVIDGDSVASTFNERNLNKFTDHPDIANYESKSIGTIDEKVIISDEWKEHGIIQVVNSKDTCKDQVRIYSRGGVEVMISTEEYHALLKAQSKFNELMKKIDDTNTKLKKGEQQAIYRLEWMLLAKKWIEHIEMYDPNKVYPLIQWTRD